MALREVEGPPGSPWNRRLNGRVDVLTVRSEFLAGNPLGDPSLRPLYVYEPPGADASGELASIYVIQGFTGQLDMWLNRSAFEPTMLERLDELFTSNECPPCVVIFVDAWTSYGGSQFINSVSTGRYMDYLCDEVVPFVDERYATLASRDHRGLSGKSSGGYGAMVVPMLRPDTFGALASHAGDALFEVCYAPDFREVSRQLRNDFEGSYDVYFERFAASDRLDFERFGKPFEIYGYAACYSPDEANPGKASLPFDLETGQLDEEVWRKWLAWDPVRMAPEQGDALASMRRIYLDAGKSDEWYLDLGASAFARELEALGIEHTLDLFDGTHMGIQYRYPRAIAELAKTLSP